MLLAYVDESYTDEKFFLGALVVDGESATAIETGLDRLVAEYASQSELCADAELHGYELFHGKGDWSALSIRQVVNVYDRAMRIIGEAGPSIAIRGLDIVRQRRKYTNPYPPHEVVLSQLLERVNDIAAAAGSYAVVVAGEVHSEDRHRTNFRDYRRNGTLGYRTSTLPRILDTLHFGPSKDSRLLQAVDLVTFAHRRRETVTESDERARRALERMWSHVEPSVRFCSTWP